MGDLQAPRGIEPRHIHEAAGTRFHSAPFGLAGLGILLAASMFGVFGFEARRVADGPEATLAVDGPQRIRNGELFELLITVDSEAAVENLVLAIDEKVWRDVTVNTLYPTPTDEEYDDGAFVLHFGPMEAQDRLVVKIDAQINPDHAPGVNAGPITIGDGVEDVLAEIDFVMEVLP